MAVLPLINNHMKKLLCLVTVIAATAVLVTGCQKSLPAPTVKLTAVGADFTTFTFTAEATDADEIAYICLESDEEAPSVSQILAEGKTLDVSAGAVTEELTGLVSATSYKIYAAASNADAAMAGPAVLEFTTESDLFGNVKSTATLAWYFGYDGALDADLIVLSLCNAGLDEYSAMPYGEGELLRLYLYTEKSEVGDGPDMQNVVLAPGTYTLKEEAEGAFDLLGGDYGSIYAISTEEGWMGIGYESGTVTVSLEDGEYDITANLVIADGEGSKVRGTFKGQLEFADLTDGYIHFDSDMNEVMTGHSGGIYPGDGVYNDYTMTFYNCPLDESGWIVGAGYIFNSELFFDVAGGDYSGTYTPNPDWENGYANYTYLPGFVMDLYGMKMPVGTYLSEYDESGSLVRIGMVVDGDMSVSIKDGVLKMSGVFTTDKGHEITVSYEGPENLTDMTGGMSTSSMTVKPAPKPAEKVATSGWRAL